MLGPGHPAQPRPTQQPPASAQAQGPPWPHTAHLGVPVLLWDALEPGPLVHSERALSLHHSQPWESGCEPWQKT